MMNDELRQEIEDDGFDPDAVEAWAECVGGDVTEWDSPTRENFEDSYEGEWNSFREYVQETCCEIGLSILDGEQVTKMFSYIDWDQVEYDWECSGEWFTSNASSFGVYVFRAV